MVCSCSIKWSHGVPILVFNTLGSDSVGYIEYANLVNAILAHYLEKQTSLSSLQRSFYKNFSCSIALPLVSPHKCYLEHGIHFSNTISLPILGDGSAGVSDTREILPVAPLEMLRLEVCRFPVLPAADQPQKETNSQGSVAASMVFTQVSLSCQSKTILHMEGTFSKFLSS